MKKQKENIWIKIIRILIACLFIWSGLMKAVDPVASAIKFDEYFISFGMGFLHPLSMFFGVALSSAEFILGFMMLFRIKVKLTSLFYLLFMIFFTLLTLWLALAEYLEMHHGYDFGVVKDCGCFGQAVTMTNLQTFLKNVILIIPVILIFCKRKTIPDIALTELGKWCFAGIGAIIILIIQWYCYRHLPIIDFTNWRKGDNVATAFIEKPAQKEIIFSFLNKNDSTITTLNEEELMTVSDKNPDFYSQYDYLDRKDSILSPFQKAEHDGFNMLDTNGADHASPIFYHKGNVFILFMHDLDEVNIRGLQSPKLQLLVDSCEKNGVPFVAITNSPQEDITAFIKEHTISFPIYCNNIDPIRGPFMVRDAVRSNPGLMLINDGIVVDKWAWRDFPDYTDIK